MHAFLNLDKIADRTEALKWHLSMLSLVNAVKAGEKLSDIRSFLDDISSNNPGNDIKRRLDDLKDMTTAVVNKGPATLLECHPQTRKPILANSKLRAHYK